MVLASNNDFKGVVPIEGMDVSFCVFDWSGVISDDRRPVFAANNTILEKLGHPVMKDYDDWLPTVKLTVQDFWEARGIEDDWRGKEAGRVLAGLGDDDRKTITHVYGSFFDLLFANYKAAYEEEVRSGNSSVAYADAKSALSRIKGSGRTIAVLSSHPASTLLAEAERYGVAGLLSKVVGSAREKVEGLANMCAYMGFVPNKTLYTGDTIYDVRAGKGAGCATAAVTTGYHLRPALEAEQPDILVGSLTELVALLEITDAH
jgi:phosphoglycolate phosphatase-like HAD superfamily hydrolase